MYLPYSRPRLIEIHEQAWCPPSIRRPIQTMLAFLWTHRIAPFQARAPYEAVVDIVQRVLLDIEDEDERDQEDRGTLQLLDCCSGAGGPVPAIERDINSRRSLASKPPVKVFLSDIHPHLESWIHHSMESPTRSLSYLTFPVDAAHVPAHLKEERHLRTFFLAFHHFSEDAARRVLEDAMRTAEGICIFELQAPDLGSIVTILALFPLSFLLIPFQHPTITTLLFTYIIPIIPAILIFDGLVSAWRTRSPQHIQYLAGLAAMTVQLEGGDKEGEWKWESGGGVHTWPWGRMSYVIGRRDRGGDDD
ncbi:hypothetical protein BCR39DRAFT_566630 [Naematelia encephala]|uniref:Methyltransferase domain-containing protein n=1 Tax=Naematelia encephala TaxID=71784 RepID=A0A1Y2APH5_9TREE|nr:hypothetical protein BCR39DRAFT_566630 [Naematelia encephala]